MITKPKSKLSWLQSLNLISPKAVRMVARKHRGRAPMTNEEIAVVSGLSVGTVRRLYSLNNWNAVTTETIQRYTAACGVDLRRPGRTIVKFLRDTRATHMRVASHPHKVLYARLQKKDK